MYYQTVISIEENKTKENIRLIKAFSLTQDSISMHHSPVIKNKMLYNISPDGKMISEAEIQETVLRTPQDSPASISYPELVLCKTGGGFLHLLDCTKLRIWPSCLKCQVSNYLKDYEFQSWHRHRSHSRNWWGKRNTK